MNATTCTSTGDARAQAVIFGVVGQGLAAALPCFSLDIVKLIRAYDHDGQLRYLFTIGGQTKTTKAKASVDCAAESKDARFHFPHFIYRNPWANEVYVSDNIALQVFRASDGLFLCKFNIRVPRGVVVSDKGEIFVAEGIGNCVSVFGKHGDALRSFGHGRFANPGGLCEFRGELFVADRKNAAIQVFDMASGVFKRSFGTLTCPTGLCVSKAGELFVSDFQAHTVSVFSAADGSLLRTIGKPASLDTNKTTALGTFCAPAGVAFDGTEQYLFISDTAYDKPRVQVFSCDGRVLWSCKTAYSLGVASDEDGRLFVTQYDNHCVAVYCM